MANGRDAKLWKLETSAGVQAVNWRSIVLDAQGQVDKFYHSEGEDRGLLLTGVQHQPTPVKSPDRLFDQFDPAAGGLTAQYARKAFEGVLDDLK